jgi:hypothetical protein
MKSHRSEVCKVAGRCVSDLTAWLLAKVNLTNLSNLLETERLIEPPGLAESFRGRRWRAKMVG